MTLEISKEGYWQGYAKFNKYCGYTFKCSENLVAYAYPVQVYVHTDDVLSVSYSEEVTHTTTTYWTVLGEESSRSDSFGVGTTASTDNPGDDLVGRVPYYTTGIFHQDVHGDPIVDASWLCSDPLVSYITYQWYDGQWFEPHPHDGLEPTHEIVVTGVEATETFTEGTEGGDGQSVSVAFGGIISVDILSNSVWATETYEDSVSITVKEAPENTANHYGVYVNGAYVHVWFLYSEPIT